jgi:tetratricopeptide (TPR) repeat protein
MRLFLYPAFIAAALVVAGFICTSHASAQIRTAPDIQTPENYQPGTGVNRLGIMSNSNAQRRTTNYVVPGGGYYYYGWSPGGYSYYDDYYYDGYYNDGYFCPYCGSRWCRGACRYRGPIYYPPVTANPRSLYGPGAVRQFLGVDGGGNNNDAAGGAQRVARAQAPDVPAQLSNPTTRARAWKFVEYGDRHFKKGDYRRAAERYRKAESQASEIPEVYFRQGFAELGAGNYPDAVLAMQQGLARKPDWPSSGFVLEELYPSPEAKRGVFRQLHTHLADHPNDADALFLLSVLQHFDGQTEAAEVGFRRVVELTGIGNHARAFLPAAPEAEDAVELGFPEERVEPDGPLLP